MVEATDMIEDLYEDVVEEVVEHDIDVAKYASLAQQMLGEQQMGHLYDHLQINLYENQELIRFVYIKFKVI